MTTFDDVLTEGVNLSEQTNINWEDTLLEGVTIAESGAGTFTLMPIALLEDIAGDDTAESTAILLDTLFETLNVDDTGTGVKIVLASATDAFTVDDTMTMNAIISAVLEDGGSFGMILSVAGAQFVAWVANADTFAHSAYDHFDFDSMCRLGERYYGTKEDGIYRLDGSDDAGTPIDWFMTLPTTDADTALFKRLVKAYLGFKSDGTVILRTIVDGGAERIYAFNKISPTLMGSGTTLGRGVKSRYWTFDLLGLDGSDLELDQIEFYPVVLGRRSG